MELVLQKKVSRIIIACLMICLSACVNRPSLHVSDKVVRGTTIGASTGAVVGSIAGFSTIMGAGIGGTAGYIIGYDIRRNMSQLQILETRLMKGGVQFIRLGTEYKLVLPVDYLFYRDAPRLNHTGRFYLNDIARYLTFFDITAMRIVGYTDNEGLAERNMALSNAQAQSVAAYLVKHRPDIRVITSRGFGADYPIATNSDAKGRALNRRVEIIFRFNLCPADRGRWFWPDLADCQKWVTVNEPFVRVS